jgi:hypothetical protein
VLGDDSGQRRRQIDEQMKAIRHLNGARRRLARRAGILAASVATDDRDPRMRAQPSREGVLRAIRQEINHATALEIAENRPVHAPLRPRPIIHAEHARRRGGAQIPAMEAPKDYVRAGALARTRSSAARRAPGRAPRRRLIAVSASAARLVRRPYGTTVSGKRSVTMCRRQVRHSQ